MSTNKIDMIKCTLNSRWMTAIERAYIMIISPTGNYVRIDKKNMGKLTDPQRELMWKCANAYNGTSNNTIELTKSEMSELITMGNIAGYLYKKK